MSNWVTVLLVLVVILLATALVLLRQIYTIVRRQRQEARKVSMGQPPEVGGSTVSDRKSK